MSTIHKTAISAMLAAFILIAGARETRAEVAVTVTVTVPQAPADPAGTCDLFRTDVVEDPASKSCRRCHDGEYASAGTNHPVDIDYAAASRRRNLTSYRSADEVVSRGILLPDGQIRCVTCHDGRSPWRYGLAIPAGAKLETATEWQHSRPVLGGDVVDPLPRGASLGRPKDRTSVEPRPLCIACHAFG